MRCLYCGKQLALFKRLIGGGEFCSEAHKHSYHEEYNRLALNRLLQAQSKSDEPKPPALQPTVAPQPKSAPSRESEPSRTSAPPSEQKRISTAIEALPTDPIAPPPQASFIAETLLTRIPSKREAPPSTAVQVFEPGEISHPVLASRETNLVLPTTGLLKLATIPGARGGASQLRTTDACSLAITLSNPPLDLVTWGAGFEPADLVQLDVQPMAPTLAEAALESAIEFVFSSNAGHGVAPADKQHRIHVNQAPLQGLLSLKMRPIAPSKLEAPIVVVPLMATLELALPVNSPLALRPKVVVGDAGKAREALTKLAMALEKPVPQEAKAQPDVPDLKESSIADVFDDELPPFLRDQEDKSGKRWGSFQKYLKNLVGCLVVASLCNVAGSRGGFGYYSGGEPPSLKSVRFTDIADLTRSPSGRSEWEFLA